MKTQEPSQVEKIRNAKRAAARYVGLIGHQHEGDENRKSTLKLLPGGGFEVVGNLPHGYQFRPATFQDGKAIENHIANWIARED